MNGIRRVQALAFRNPIRNHRRLKIPRHTVRQLAFALGFLGGFLALALPASAQGISLLRDTETEQLLRSYEIPLAKAAGLDPTAVHVYLVGDPTVNSFVAGGQNIFIQTGMILFAKTPNELTGVLAHETGHIKAGHLTRGEVGMQKAAIPMLLSLVVGLAAMVAGAGEAGAVIMSAGQAIAQAQFTSFTYVQEGTADQIALQLLNATHQSPMGLYDTFQRFAEVEAQHAIAYRPDPYAADHPVGQDRLAYLQKGVDASPYRDVKDSPAALHAYLMMQAKLAGFVLPVNEVFDRYPLSDTSEPARYARAMAYMRQPNLKKALSDIQSLIADEPRNPFFYEVLGQIYLSMARPEQSLPAYQKCVDLMPSAPQLRLGLATAQLATGRKDLAKAALTNLKAATLVENDDPFTWYETAQAYSELGNEPMANLSTAELYYSNGGFKQAYIFASRAQHGLAQGSADWERANDITMASAASLREQR
jgi:predicted Zn-dependent protease